MTKLTVPACSPTAGLPGKSCGGGRWIPERGDTAEWSDTRSAGARTVTPLSLCFVYLQVVSQCPISKGNAMRLCWQTVYM